MQKPGDKRGTAYRLGCERVLLSYPVLIDARLGGEVVRGFVVVEDEARLGQDFGIAGRNVRSSSPSPRQPWSITAGMAAAIFVGG